MIVGYDEGDLAQRQIQPDTPYHRWNIDIEFVKDGNDVSLHSVHLNVRRLIFERSPVNIQINFRSTESTASIAVSLQ